MGRMVNKELNEAIDRAKRAWMASQGGYAKIEADAYGHDRMLENNAGRVAVDLEKLAQAEHGYEHIYTHLGCRCTACTQAATEARAARRRAQARPRRHGTNSAYANGCRCDDCRQARTAYAREKKKARDAA